MNNIKIKRRICVITGSRAEYGLLHPVMEEIQKEVSLELQLIVTGMHLNREFGYTASLITKDGFSIDRQIPIENRIRNKMALVIAKGITGISKALDVLKPDIVLILGDRTEALSAAIATVYQNIILAHIHGGDITQAGMDESARHAITKLANIHFAATLKSKSNIINMGEKAKHVFQSGNPGLDQINLIKLLSKQEVIRLFNLEPTDKYIILLQHPVTTQSEDAGKQMQETIEAVKFLKIPTIIIYPNSDNGTNAVINEIQKAKSEKFIRIFKNLPRDIFLSALKYSAVLLGNSSSGIIEAPYLKVAVVNIGIRQKGRERSNNIIDVDHNKYKIITAINKALYNRKFLKNLTSCPSIYGDGQASKRIVKVLKNIKINQELLQKQLTYE